MFHGYPQMFHGYPQAGRVIHRFIHRVWTTGSGRVIHRSGSSYPQGVDSTGVDLGHPRPPLPDSISATLLDRIPCRTRSATLDTFRKFLTNSYRNELYFVSRRVRTDLGVPETVRNPWPIGQSHKGR